MEHGDGGRVLEQAVEPCSSEWSTLPSAWAMPRCPHHSASCVRHLSLLDLLLEAVKDTRVVWEAVGYLFSATSPTIGKQIANNSPKCIILSAPWCGEDSKCSESLPRAGFSLGWIGQTSFSEVWFWGSAQKMYWSERWKQAHSRPLQRFYRDFVEEWGVFQQWVVWAYSLKAIISSHVRQLQVIITW